MENADFTKSHQNETMTSEECQAFSQIISTLELLKSKAETETLRLELLKCQIKSKYNLGDADRVDYRTGLITRSE